MWTRVSITLLVLISIKLHSYIILFDRGIWCSSCLSYFLLLKVDRHPQFRHSRCFFVIRTDGGWIDFSYQKCLRAYIRNKYPSFAERFIREHFKRGSWWIYATVDAELWFNWICFNRERCMNDKGMFGLHLYLQIYWVQ